MFITIKLTIGTISTKSAPDSPARLLIFVCYIKVYKKYTTKLLFKMLVMYVNSLLDSKSVR